VLAVFQCVIRYNLYITNVHCLAVMVCSLAVCHVVANMRSCLVLSLYHNYDYDHNEVIKIYNEYDYDRKSTPPKFLAVRKLMDIVAENLKTAWE